MVDQLANEYATGGKPVVFLEQDLDAPLGSRYNRWWAAHGPGSVSLPLVMVSSGHQISNGYLGSSAHDTYQAMIEAELARPPQAEITATAQRLSGDKLHFNIQLTNLSGVTLSSSNAATVHAIVYERHTPVDTNTDHITERIVRAAVATAISPALASAATATFELETAALTNVVDWNKIYSIVLVDYRPAGSSGPYDMLQAAAVESQPSLTVSKQATPDPVQPGAPLTYTIRVANTGDVTLHAVVTDTLPAQVIPSGVLTWTPTITAPGGVWEHTFVVTVAPGYTGALLNRVEVTSAEGATGSSSVISNGGRNYLPLILRN